MDIFLTTEKEYKNRNALVVENGLDFSAALMHNSRTQETLCELIQYLYVGQPTANEINPARDFFHVRAIPESVSKCATILLMRRCFLLFLLTCVWLAPSVSQAAVEIVDQPDPFTLTFIDEPEKQVTYLGELDGFPHTFEIIATQPFGFSMDLMSESLGGEESFSGILVVEVERGVKEVDRMRAVDADWEESYDQIYGLTFLQGPTYDVNLEPGFYRFEVSAPLNEGKYRLQLGDVRESGGYFSLLNDIYVTKRFFGHARMSIINTPLVYGPLLIIMGLTTWLYIRKLKRRNEHE